jgi:hypothetical protein
MKLAKTLLITLVCVASGCATSESSTRFSRQAVDTPPAGSSPSPQADSTRSEQRVLAAIDFGDERTKDAITAPDTVAVGQDFQI